jgi:DNA-binding beta-propeller fold protein YncE
MKVRNLLLATASLALTVGIASAVMAQNKPAPTGAMAGPGATGAAVAPRSRNRHLLFIATPGGGGADGQSGIVVLDADRDYRFVKRISYGLPAARMPGPEISGMTASVPENKIYVTTDGGDMLAFDLTTDKIVWDFKGEKTPVATTRGGAATDGCCERPYTLPGGHALLVASAYNHWWWFIDAHIGNVLGKIDTPDAPNSHNLTVTADGKMAALASLTPVSAALAPKSSPAHLYGKPNVAIADLYGNSGKVRCYITFDDSPRPLTMNHDGSLIYVNVNNLDGFEIADTKTCKMIKRVELPGDLWKAKWANPNGQTFGHGLPSHGIGMTPDESEIWVTDSANDAWQIWDNPGDGRNPVYNPSKTVKIQQGIASSWITMSNDGKLAFTGDGSIINVRAHKVIGIMKDEYGNLIHTTEKVAYITFDESGKMIETTNQFAIGMADAYNARMQQSTPNKQASK